MVLRSSWLVLPLFCLSCHSLRPPLTAGAAPVSAPQEAAVPDPLHLAAVSLEAGNLGEACGHLLEHLQAHPQQTVVRARYAEVLLRLQRLPAARDEYEQVVADEQELGSATARHLIHCHRRLMEIAAACDDDYGEHLHRGIGLYLLARERQRVPGVGDELPAESLLCKAAAELTLAQLQAPHEARPAWYLHCIWVQLGQHQAAVRCLREAVAEAPFAYLTSKEQRALLLARPQVLEESRPR